MCVCLCVCEWKHVNRAQTYSKPRFRLLLCESAFEHQLPKRRVVQVVNVACAKKTAATVGKRAHVVSFAFSVCVCAGSLSLPLMHAHIHTYTHAYAK